jgi:hypothetical protein
VSSETLTTWYVKKRNGNRRSTARAYSNVHRPVAVDATPSHTKLPSYSQSRLQWSYTPGMRAKCVTVSDARNSSV